MISSYFKNLEHHKTPGFIAEVTTLAFISRFIISFPAILIVSLLGFNLGRPNIDMFEFGNQTQTIIELIYICIIGPFIETIIFQLIPIKVLQFFRINVPITIFLTTLLFAYAHLHEGLVNFVGIMPISFLLVWAFVVRQKISTKNALFSVFFIHGLTNFIAAVLYLVTR